MNGNEYWRCTIGPIDRSKVPFGGDFPLRNVVQDTFIEMFGKQAETCSSGWGLKPDMKGRLDIIGLLPFTDPSGEILKKIDEILETRPR